MPNLIYARLERLQCLKEPQVTINVGLEHIKTVENKAPGTGSEKNMNSRDGEERERLRD